MTTDDDMREIEAALDELIALLEQAADRWPDVWEPRRERVLALIRQKLPKHIGDQGDHRIDIQTDGSGKAEGCTVYMTDKDGKTTKFLPVTDDAEHERAAEAWHLRFREHTRHWNSEDGHSNWSGVGYEALRLMRARPAIDKAAGELLRAAKGVVDQLAEKQDRDDLQEAIEAAERAGI